MKGFVFNFNLQSPSRTKDPKGTFLIISPDNRGELTEVPGGSSTVHCTFHYLHLYTKIGYYCGVIPFRLKFNADTTHYQLCKVNIFQKVQTVWLA